MSDVKPYVNSVRKGWVRMSDMKAFTSWWVAVRSKPRGMLVHAWVDVYSDGTIRPHPPSTGQRRSVQAGIDEDETFGLMSDLTGQM